MQRKKCPTASACTNMCENQIDNIDSAESNATIYNITEAATANNFNTFLISRTCPSNSERLLG